MKFKTLLTILGVGIITTATINAQEHETKSPWTVGIKGGFLFTEDSYGGNTSSLLLGLTAEYDLGNKFHIRSGLEFMDKSSYADGDRSEYSTSNSEGGYIYSSKGMYCDLSTTFLQIPITIGYRLPVSKKVNLTLNAGIFVDIALWSDGYYSKWDNKRIVGKEGETILWEDTSQSENIKNSKNWDMGLMAGIGIEYRKFSYDLNYEYGFIDQSVNAYKDIGGGSIKNKGISLTATYRF